MENNKINLLDFFYEHIEESDWLEGLDLYQAGKVKKLNDFNGLITAKISLNLKNDFEVRLKIHPNGRVIQWIECTCYKNRKYSQYCEHIAAFMISIDQEKSKLFNQLDNKMPLKPPMAAIKRKMKLTKTQDDNLDQTIKKENAAQTLLEHGSIHSISLIAKGPTVRVRLMIKEGQLSHFDLKLDDAAKFLMANGKLKTASSDIKKLKVSKHPVMKGTRIYLTDKEKVVAERVIGIKHGSKALGKAKSSAIGELNNNYYFYSENLKKPKKGIYEFISVKSADIYIGKEFFFLPERGFWPLSKEIYHPSWEELPLKKVYKDDNAARFIDNNFSEYLSKAPIWLDDPLTTRLIKVSPKINQVKIHMEKDGWFFLDPSYGDDRETVSMVDLINHFHRKKRSFLEKGNSWIKVPDFIKEHNWNLDESGKYIKVDTIGLLRLKAQTGDFDKFVGKKSILNHIRSRLELKKVEKIPELNHTNLRLRKYQTAGLKWMWWLSQNSLHGLLADEMGLGKTHQAMGIMSATQKTLNRTARFIVVAPTTVLDHWLDKIIDFCPNLLPIKYHGPKRRKSIQDITDGRNFTLITSYGILLRDIKEISTIYWDAIILDEAHFAKNNDTATYRAVCRLNGKSRFCLTGTPMENHLGEIKNIFDFLVPGYLGSNEYFKKQFLNPIKQNNCPKAESMLQKLIYPFKLRRTKNQVLKDLPAKVEDIRHCALSSEQVKLYKNILSLKASGLIKQLKNSNNPIPYLHVFATLTLLKQICNHPALIIPGSSYLEHESGKFDLFKEIIQEALDSNHKVVVYSQYVEMIKIFHQYLTSINIDHAILTGQTRNRGKLIERFQTTPDCKVFLGSLLAGGIGIDLTAASVVVHYDRWWNASKENQATDRVHRIGQHKNVQVLKLISRGTLEEKINNLIQKKQNLFEKFLDHDEQIFKQFDREQLIDLLQ